MAAVEVEGNQPTPRDIGMPETKVPGFLERGTMKLSKENLALVATLVALVIVLAGR